MRYSLLILKRGRGVDNTGRGLAMKLCQERCGMKLWEMAKLLKIGSAVSRSVTRMNGVLASDIGVEKNYKCILKDLTP